MIRKSFILKNETGFHARPVSFFVKAAAGFESDVILLKDTVPYNAKSILGLLSMGAGMGTELVLQVDGPDEAAAMDALLKVLEDMV